MIANQLTELVRVLEQRDHTFPADPAAITAQLRQTDGSLTDKLHRRAALIDRDHTLIRHLQQHQMYRQWLFYAALGAWAVLGFVGTYSLMRQSAVNFFALLIGALGVNTVVLMIWSANMVLRRPSDSHPFNIMNLLIKSDSIHQTVLQLDREPIFQKYSAWRKSVLAHQLALSGLIGMFAAALLLLLVRQYRFTWESTLLSHETFTKCVAVLSWLPEKLGFPVPDTAAVIASRNHLDEVNAAAWSGLLLGSLLCYGVLPRALAWAVSAWRARRHQPALDLNLPYYQNITQKWQRRIVDNDSDYAPDRIRVSAPISLQPNHQHQWAVSLDVLPEKTQWYQTVLGQEWLDLGIIASREDWTDLINRVENQSVQLLAAVRAAQTPDRGTIRRLANVHAPVVLWLWGECENERLAQWHDIAGQYGWACLDNIDMIENK